MALDIASAESAIVCIFVSVPRAKFHRQIHLVLRSGQKEDWHAINGCAEQNESFNEFFEYKLSRAEQYRSNPTT
jgi:hypothetical protein